MAIILTNSQVVERSYTTGQRLKREPWTVAGEPTLPCTFEKEYRCGDHRSTKIKALGEKKNSTQKSDQLFEKTCDFFGSVANIYMYIIFTS